MEKVTWEEWNKTDQCAHCIVRGHRSKCEHTTCSVRYSWYVLQVESEKNQLQAALRTLIQAAKAMPEHSYTPAQMALDDAIEAADEVMKEATNDMD